MTAIQSAYLNKPFSWNVFFDTLGKENWPEMFSFVFKRKWKSEIIYPESDGKPMADNTKQYKLIVMIKENLEHLFANQDDVFIAADLFWYPVEFNNKLKYAPDVMVAFGRPKGDRRSYLQWKENNIAPQVVFEILSHCNTDREMKKKFRFYQRYGVKEYYVYDPEKFKLEGWIRSGPFLKEIPFMNGWISPILNIKFDTSQNDLTLYDSAGNRFTSLTDAIRMADQEQQCARQEKVRADQEKARADQEKKKAAQEKARADQEKARADQEKEKAVHEKARADRAEKDAALALERVAMLEQLLKNSNK